MKANKFEFEGRNIKSVETILDESNTNFIAEPQELITASGIEVPNNYGIVRTDTSKVIGVVGKRYHPQQNFETFSLFDTICQEYDAKYSYVYEINGGSKIMIQAEIGNGFEARSGDHVKNYITAINSFDGSTPLLVWFSGIRLWCQNQFRASLKEATNKISIRHTRNAEDKMKEAMHILGVSIEYFKHFEVKCKTLANKAVDKTMVEKFLTEVIGSTEDCSKKQKSQIENKKEKVTQLFENGKGNNGSSMWDLYNGYTEYIDHHRGNNENKRLASAIIGNGESNKVKAFDVAMSLV
jgi:phage/plasmid-like protein (TIGR03299 family)